MQRLLLLSLLLGLSAAVACGDDGGSGGSGSGAGGSAQATGTTTGSTPGTGTGGADQGDPCDRVPEACFDAATCYVDPPADVSFRDDVLPLFQRSCGLSTACHGNPDSPTSTSGYRPYLASKLPAESDIPAIRAAIIDVESYADPSKSVVAPGDLGNSFMMYALDGALDQCGETSCPDDCGFLMPKGLQKPLPIAERNLIRAWIEQGAQDN